MQQTQLNRSGMQARRKDIQMIFQDPQASLNPRMKVSEIIGEPLREHHAGSAAERRERVLELMDQVGLNRDFANRYPHEFSGGQRQRIAIARAMVLRPRLVVLDEPTSALDMTVQVQIVSLLRDLQKKYDLAYLFISHDLKVVRAMSHKVIVMKQGDVVEMGTSDEIFDTPQDPYTQTLLAAAFDLAHGAH